MMAYHVACRYFGFVRCEGSENGSARDIRNAFKATLDKKTYKVESDDEQDVFVKTRKNPDFAIELVESTVKGTRVNLYRE